MTMPPIVPSSPSKTCSVTSPASVTGLDDVRTLVLLLLTLLPALTSADNGVRMKVRPVLCIVDERTPSCQMSFLVAWESDAAGYSCLYNDFGRAALRCWTEQRSGEHSDERSVDAGFSYWMSRDTSDAPLAVVAIEVLRMDTDDRRRKRRSRHVWDIL